MPFLTRSRDRNRFFGQLRVWTPAQLPGLVAWWDAGDASTITLNGSNVSQWRDKSGNGRHFGQSTAANQPTYNATAMNGRPALVMGSGIRMTGTVPLDDPCTIYSVAYLTTVGSGFRRIISSGNPNTGMFFGVYAGAFATFFGNGTVWNDTNANSSLFTVSAPSVLGVVNQGAVATPYTNGNAQTNKVGTMVATTSTTLGEVSSQPWDGPISEIVIASSALSTDNRQKLEGYLAWKWSLEGNLAASHPYKNAPPLV